MTKAIKFLEPSYWLPFAAVLCLLAAAGCSTPKEREARFISRGKALLASKDYASAELEFRNAIQIAPRDAEPYYQLALVFRARNDLKGAYDLLRKALDLDPKHVDAQLQSASILAMSPGKEYAEAAETRIESVLSISPDNTAALDLRAILDLRYGKLDSALASLEKAAEKAPESVRIAWNLAIVERAKHNFTGGEAVLKKLVAGSPQSVDAVLCLGRYYVTIGRKIDAEAQFVRARQMDPKNPYALAMLGFLQNEFGRRSQAEGTYRDLSALPGKQYKSYHAMYLYQEGKRGQAVSELEKLVKQDSGDRDLRSLLVSAYVAQGQQADAEKLLVGAIKKNPNDTQALMERAEIYARIGKLKEAEQDLNAVLHFTPNSAPAHYAIAVVYGREGLEESHRQHLTETINLDPNSLQARIDLSRVMLRANNAKAALNLLDQTPAFEKRTAEYLGARDWVLFAMDDKKEVRKNLDYALASVRSPELLYQDALLRMAQKDFAGSRRSAEEILKKNPESTPALNLIVRSYGAEGNMIKGLQVLRDYSAERPKSAGVRMLTGIWMAKAGNRGEARMAFADARNANPYYELPSVALAEMDYADGNLDGARSNIMPVLAHHPDDVHSQMILAMIEEKAGNRAAAAEHYRAAIDKDPKNEDALNNLAYVLSKDKPDEALKYAQSAVELAPANAGAQDTLGWIYYRKGVYNSAVTYLKQAVATEASPVRQYHLGLAYAKVGQLALSKQNIAAALKKDPNLPKTEPID